jgi:hypothetical protein
MSVSRITINLLDGQCQVLDYRLVRPMVVGSRFEYSWITGCLTYFRGFRIYLRNISNDKVYDNHLDVNPYPVAFCELHIISPEAYNIETELD